VFLKARAAKAGVSDAIKQEAVKLKAEVQQDLSAL